MTHSSTADEYIGRTVASKFRIDSLIGEGGMGKVYKAFHQQLDKPVVLKILRHSLLSDPRTVARFQREAKAASRLNHPNSISILDYGQVEDGAHFIAMEFVSGRDLHQILSKEWPLAEGRIAHLVGQVLAALAEAHSAGVIHRDLKPENIMVELRRTGEFVKVLDFGIAKITDPSAEEGPALTRAGFVCGTPEYMSPEQARGAPLDARSDLYAVGVLLYQLVTGLLPFEADSAVGFATKHLTTVPPPPSRRRPNVRISPALEKLILRTLAKDPNDRPQTAEQFRSELLAVVPFEEREPAAQNRRTASPAAPVLVPLPPLHSGERSVSLDDQTVLTARTEVPEESELTRTETNGRPSPADPHPLRRYAAAVALVLAPIAMGAYFLLGTGDSAWTPPGTSGTAIQSSRVDPKEGGEVPLYERQVPLDRRDPAGAAHLEAQGDAAFRAGDTDAALRSWREAFAKAPDAQLALKLGELYFQRNDSMQARNWWRRHLADERDSKASAYIHRRMPDLR